MNTATIKKWVSQLWSEHLGISIEETIKLIEKPEDSLSFFKDQATRNEAALVKGLMPGGRVYKWGIKFPERALNGINLDAVASLLR
jgi:hypothetical protein